MKVNELRIGSIVADDLGTARVVESIEFDPLNLEYTIWFCDNNQSCLDALQAIPLTKQWLLKFGFEVDGDNSYWLRKKDRFTDLGYSYNIKNNIFEFNECELIDFKYVHQLQNLYFALTGEELELSLL